MNDYKKPAMLKAFAREQLTGCYTKIIPALFFHFMTVMLLKTMITSLFASQALWSDIAYFFAVFLIDVFSGLFVAAEHFIYLKVCCHFPVSAGDIFFAFVATPDRFLKIQFFLSLLNFICMFPYYVAPYVIQGGNAYADMTIATFLLLAGNLLYLFIRLKYALVYYLAIDFPNYSVRRLYGLSNEIMKGHKKKLFLIGLSFLPLMLLCMLSLGIGFLWIIPYIYATEANFYLDLMAHRNHCMASDKE